MRAFNTLYNCCKWFFLIGTLFWIEETLYFQVAYGWHWEAINQAEKNCDHIASLLWGISFLFFYYMIVEAGKAMGDNSTNEKTDYPPNKKA